MKEEKVLTLVEAKAESEGNGKLEGYGSVFGSIDSYGDTIEPGAYAETIEPFLKDGFIAWGHDWANPVATPSAAREDTRGLFLVAEFHSHAEAQRARSITSERLARGKSMGLSIGYEALEWEFRKVDTPVRGPWGEYTDKVRVLKKIKLFEVSLVTVPAEPKAQVTGAKGAELKPFANEHACRLRDPDDFKPDSFRRTTREHDGKEYAVIMGKLKGETAMTEQAYRYPKDEWSEAEARAHCKDHDGGLFEPASKAGCLDCRSTYSAHADRVLADVRDFLSRSQGLSSLRAKEGRVLSAANRQKLQTLLESLSALDAVKAEIAELLASTEPQKAAADLSRLRFEFDRTLARIQRDYGVAT